MKMLLFVLVSIFVISFCVVDCTAVEIDEEYYSELIDSAIDSDTKESLRKIGIDDFSADEIFNVSFSRIGEYFSESVSDKSSEVISAFFKILTVLIILITLKSFLCSDDGKSIRLIGTVAVVILIVDICGNTIEMLLSTMKTSGSFMLSFVPIYTVILSLGGGVTSGITYNSVTFAFAQLISFVVNNFAADITGIFLSVSIAFSLNNTINFNRFISAVNKLVSTALGLLSSGFAAILSVRGVLSVAIDSATSKSIKFLIGSLIPIVGSSISDAYSTVLGSISVIRGSVAAAGIIIMLVISVPPILEGVLYCLCLAALSYISEMAELNEISSVIRSFYSALRTVLLLNIFQLFVLIISTAIMITLKGGN